MDSAYQRKTALILHILLVFFLNVGTDAEDHAVKCPLLKVQRGTIHQVSINKTFRISCDLMYCDTFNKTFNVTWTKVNVDKWIPVSEADQTSTSQIRSSADPNILTSYLTFTKISKHHEGLYRCELQLQHVSMHSHHINVSVSDDILEGEMISEKENTDSSTVSYPWWLPYFLICSGALVLVVVVMLILILCINACKCSRGKNTKRAQVQYTATSVMSSPSPSVLKRDEFDAVHFSEETQQHSHDSSTLTLKPGQCPSHVSDSGDDPSSNRRESRSSQVVYASLHHLAQTPLSSTTSRETQEEFSEYASIRVRAS